MPKEDFTPLIKTYESLQDRATSKYEVYADFLEKFEVDIDDNVSYEEKLKKWTKQRIQLKKAKNDVSSLAKHLRSEREKLSEIYDSATKSSPIVELLDKIDDKYNPTDLLNSIREITTELENAITEVDEYVILAKELHNQQAHQDTTSRRPDQSPVNIRSRRPQIQLQAMEVPVFDGKPENYPQFIAVFDELVNRNVDFSHLQKAMYLKKALRGDAARCIEGIPATGENYARLLNKITARYSNALVNQHGIMRKLENIARAADNSSSCEKTFNDIDVILNQLTSTGLDLFDSCDPMWQRIILRKFPEQMAEKILLDSHDKVNFTINEIMNSLKKLIFGKHFLEESGFSNFSHMKNEAMRIDRNHMSSYNNEQARYRRIEKNSPNIGQQNNFYPAPLCIFCPNQQQHSTSSCNLPLRDKQSHLRVNRLCWKCFETNHTSFECSKPDCRCGGKHDPSLCRETQELANSGTSYNGNNVRFSNNGRNNTSNLGRNNFPRRENNIGPTYPNNIPINNYERQNNLPHFNHQGPANHVAAIEENTSEKLEQTEENLQSYHASINDKREKSNLPTLMTSTVKVFSPSRQQYVDAIIFFDNGSQQTLVDEKFAETTGINEGEKQVLTICGVNSISEKFSGTSINLILRSSSGEDLKIKGITKQFISNGFRAANLDANDINFIKSRNISITNTNISGEFVKPDILIGCDNYCKLVLNKAAVILPSGLHVVETIVGNCLFGTPNKKENTMESTHFVNHSCIIEDEITPNEMFKEMYELESLGIRHEGSPANERAVRFYDEFKKYISFEDKIVTAPFPLKEDISRLGSNFNLSYKQLDSLILKLKNNPDMKEWYAKKLKEYEVEGIIETVTDENEIADKVAEYYIPHHGVWNPEKKEKPLRIVFGAQSKQKGCISLNEAIQTGETFVNKIADIIMAARKKKYIVVCDLQGAFTQIRMIPQHQDLCRFLFVKDLEKGLSKENLSIWRFKRLPFGVNASPAVLNMSITAFLEKAESELGHELLNYIYVDNIMFRADDIETVKKKIKESKELFERISFNLREYVTNSREINESLPEIDKGKFGKTKLLGVPYNTDSDTFGATIYVKDDVVITKRTVLKQLHTIYDPIGLFTPAVISLRIVMRNVFEETKHWTDVVNPKLREEWLSLFHQYNNAEVTIPRYLGDEHRNAESQILWIFTDASKDASAACAFLQDKVTERVSTLITGKAKLTPKVKTPLEDTIPKFEFASILLGLEVAKNIIKYLELQGCELRLVNDSTSALSWISFSKSLRRSCNLIREKIRNVERFIKTNFNVHTLFFHCPSEYNIADIATRGFCAHELQNSDWVQGPKWVKSDISQLPFRQFFLEKIENLQEDQDADTGIIQANHIAVQIKPLFNLSNFKSTFKAKRGIAGMMNILKRKVCQVRQKLNIDSPDENSPIMSMSGGSLPSLNDFKIVETFLIKDEQRELNVESLKARYKQKSFFIDSHEVLRVSSRLMNADLSEDVKQPIVLHVCSTWLKMTIKEIHEENAHCSKEYIVMLLRQKYWIPRPSKVINSIIKECIPCSISNSLPFRAPIMPSLPKDRVLATRPFENTGVDCLGPFETKLEGKVYVCLFTCLVTRCVHLEVINGMSGGDFLKSFIRFVARRGKPKIMRSDNGTNFVLGCRLIQKLYESNSATRQFCDENGIEWFFNPPSAPWMGGVWEICVKSVKQAFYKTIGKHKLSVDSFQTMIIKIEGIINSRPLTTMSEENPDPLRPVDFLIPRIEISLPNFNADLEEDEYIPNTVPSEDEARRSVEKIEKLTNMFWRKFKMEYLPKLRDSQKARLKQGRTRVTREPEVGEIVIIEDDYLPKYRWNLAKIVELYRGNDGQVRSALVNSDGQRLQRPVIKLYSLELKSGKNNKIIEQEVGNISNGSEHEIVSTITRRRANINAKEKIKQNLTEENEYNSSDED